MPTKKKNKSNTKLPDRRLNFGDAKLFARMEKIFVARGFGGMSLTKQAKNVFEEWCAANEAKASK
jgi:hypothetical protein